MCQKNRSRVLTFTFALALLLCLAPLAEAVDGIVLIDQNRALAGNVTPGDLPGFPVTISRPGSFRLSGNLDIADPNVSGIEITVNNVTLDLNGFTIQGPLDQCSFPLAPIWCSNLPSTAGVISMDSSISSILNITVLNGTVRAMPNDGVRLGHDSHVERVTATDNGRTGIVVLGGSIVTGNRANRNGDTGIRAAGSVLTANTASRNGRYGAVVTISVFSNNVVSLNVVEDLVHLNLQQFGGNLCGGSSC